MCQAELAFPIVGKKVTGKKVTEKKKQFWLGKKVTRKKSNSYTLLSQFYIQSMFFTPNIVI